MNEIYENEEENKLEDPYYFNVILPETELEQRKREEIYQVNSD